MKNEAVFITLIIFVILAFISIMIKEKKQQT